eukprot:SAG31_NODE_28625_length_407_cov_1.116883_1_plen_45_part_01
MECTTPLAVPAPGGTDYIGICGKPAEFRLWHTTVSSLASVFARIL